MRSKNNLCCLITLMPLCTTSVGIPWGLTRTKFDAAANVILKGLLIVSSQKWKLMAKTLHSTSLHIQWVMQCTGWLLTIIIKRPLKAPNFSNFALKETHFWCLFYALQCLTNTLYKICTSSPTSLKQNVTLSFENNFLYIL